MNEAPVPRCHSSGPSPAEILIVGEAPGYEELRAGVPFVSAAGQELTRMLHDAGLIRADCRLTHVTPFRPPGGYIKEWFYTKTEGGRQGAPWIAGRFPSKEVVLGLEELRDEVARTSPKVIIALGDTALWALTGESSVSKWRGSELTLTPVWEGPYDPDIRVIPTYHPAGVLRNWSWRSVACYDLSKAGRPAPPEPEWDFTVPEVYAAAKSALEDLRHRLEEAGSESLWLSCDIETRDRRVIDCIGFAWGRASALSIPFLRASDYSFLFTEEEEADLILLIREILLHPNARIIGQNWYYDAQFIARVWGFLPPPAFDTMVGHATAYPGTPKSLDYLSSIYLPYHRYWKGESGEAEATADDALRWQYNCKDCCSTWELREPIQATLEKHGLEEAYAFEHSIFLPLVSMMLRGTRQDNSLRGEYAFEVIAQISQLEDFFEEFTAEVLPDVSLAKSKTAKPWWRSPTQQTKLFYEVLRLPKQVNKKTRRPTADDGALAKLMKTEPVFLPLFLAISNYRSLNVFLSTFIQVKLDHDGRMRCSYNPVGTETFRFNSSADIYGFGGNLQNIPTGDG